MASRWKSRSSFTSGLLARSTEAQPLKAPSPSVPVRPLIITTEPLSRTSALADSGACNRPGASSVSSTGMFCRSIGGAGAVALISNLSGCSPARALPVSLILRSASISDVGVDALDAVLHAVAQLENTMVPSVTVTCSIVGASHRRSPEGAAWLADGRGVPLRSRSSGTFSTGRMIDEFGDLRLARPHARQRHVGLRRCRR